MKTRIKYINAGKDTLSSFIPAKYLNNITSENSLFFAAFSDAVSDSVSDARAGLSPIETLEDNPEGPGNTEGGSENMSGVILYKTNTVNPWDVSLEYIFVKNEFRSKGVAKTLLNETFRVLKLNKKTGISCRIFTESLKEDTAADMLQDTASSSPSYLEKPSPGNTDRRVENLLGSFGFKPEKKGNIMVFSMASLLENCFTPDLMVKLRPFISNVKMISEIDKSLLSDFAAFLERKGRRANLKTLDPEFTRYYVENGKILGYALIKELQPEVLLMEDTITLPGSGSSRVVPSIIASLLEYYLDYMDEDSVLAVDISNNKIKEAMISQFGKPALVKMYTEYVLSL